MLKFLRLNLQHFAEGDAPGNQGSTPPPQGDNSYVEYSELPEYEGGLQPDEFENNLPNPLLVEDVDNTDPNQQETPQPPNPEANQAPEFDFGGRKVRLDDPDSVRGAHQDWQQQQQYIQQLQQQNKQFQQMMDTIQQNQQNTVQQTQQQQPQGPSTERMEQIHNEYMDKMYDNVFEAQKWLHQQPEYREFLQQQVEPMIQPYVQPYEQERQYQKQIQDMQQQHADFDQLIPQMQELLNERPDLGNRDDALETVYWMAKGQSINGQNTPPTPEQLMNDPDFQQQILSNESIRNQIIQQYTGQKQQTIRNTPPVMGKNPSGNSPAYQDKTPRTLAEGSRAFRRSLGLN